MKKQRIILIIFSILQILSFISCTNKYAQNSPKESEEVLKNELEQVTQNELQTEGVNKQEEMIKNDDEEIVQSETKELIQIEAEKTKIEINEEFKITINTKNVSVAACTIRLHFDAQKVELISSPENSHKIEDTILYTWYDNQGAKRKVPTRQLAEFTFKAKQNGSCLFAIEGEFYDEKEQKIEPSSIPLEIRIGEEPAFSEIDEQILEETSSDDKKNSNLAILRLEQEGISPDFEKEINEYYITVSEKIESLAITAIPENENSKVTITGNTSLKNGLNTIRIKVEAEDTKHETEYKIYVTKTSDLNSANANLENLAIENAVLEPTFWEGVTNYKVAVPNNVESLNILAVPQNEKASIKITGADQLKEGNNKVTITVTAKNDNTFKKYEVDVYKKSKIETEKEEQEKQELEQQENQPIPAVVDNSKEIEQIQVEQRELQTKGGVWILWSVIVVIAISGIIGIVIVKRKNNKKDK